MTAPASPGREGAEGLDVTAEGGVLTVVFDRPRQRNAMTWAMYEGLHAACERADADESIRMLVLRGSGRTFVAGTDITQFEEFSGGADGVAYERRISQVLRRLGDVDVPTVAAVEGYCVGGGLALAAACDLRIATPDSRFGAPIARTLGNCLSVSTHALLVDTLGLSRTVDLLLNARLLTGAQAYQTGLVGELTDDLDHALSRAVDRLLGHSPLAMWATKEAVRRLRAARLPDDEDIVERVYGSRDFAAAVRAFAAKETTTWTGR